MKFISHVLRWFRRAKPIITIADRAFTPILANVILNHIPNVNDLLYFDPEGQQYSVVNVIHYVGDHHGIWVIVEPFNQD